MHFRPNTSPKEPWQHTTDYHKLDKERFPRRNFQVEKEKPVTRKPEYLLLGLMGALVFIDPGFKNLGFLIGQYRLTEEACTCTIDTARSGVVTVVSNEADYDHVDALYQGVQLLVAAALEFTAGQPTVVLIEKQWLNPFNSQVGFQLHGLQAIIFALFKEAGADVLFVNPSRYKNVLRIHPNPNESKRKASLAFAKKLLGDSAGWLKSDHLADCVNQLFYYLSTTFQADVELKLG